MTSEGPVTHGASLVFEDLPAGWAPLRVRPCEDAMIRVIAGEVRVTTDESESVLRPGEETMIPAGSCYRLASVAGVGRTLTGYRSSHRQCDDRSPWS